ncbi:MAG: hypothetical protein JNM58_00795 [Xanthomonadaceae bacterium]|nr:hypothetical protein [Xanthomonadaceae bacterium]
MTKTTDLCYPVLVPFKFQRTVVKPPAFVQMGRDEAREYIAAGVIGGEEDAALVPNDEAERLAAEEAARQEAERLAAEEAARLEAERLAAEEAERQEAEKSEKQNTATGEDGKTGAAKEGDTTTPAAKPAAGGRGGSARRAGK